VVRLASELDVDAVLGEQGIIAEHIPGFRPRQAQIEMARLIAEAIAAGEHRIIEASTGIGKSFAYLVPAFLSEGRVVISTGTKTLQDQLFNKDIPLINKTLVSGKQVALLKGRANYACSYRIRKHRQQRRFQTRELAPVFDALTEWVAASRSGDIAEFSGIPENDSLWFHATSNADNCLGAECPDYEDCFVVRARRKAQDADLVVINHHLFFSDQALKEQGFGELLPDVDLLIFDEAHQLPDVASNFYGRGITLRQLELLLRDCVDAQLREARDDSELQPLCDATRKALADFRLLLGGFSERGEWRHIENAPRLRQGLAEWQRQLGLLAERLELLSPRGKELSVCHGRLEAYRETLADFLQPPAAFVNWYEWNEHSFRLMLSPVDVSQQFRQQIGACDYRSVIFTSATLSAGGSFDYFARRLGIEEVPGSRFDSPFDYAAQARLFLPRDLPPPGDDAFFPAFADLCCELIDASEGNAFLLFTSYRMLQMTARHLKGALRNPLFVQGERQRSELLEAYLRTPHAVLLGTSSFWEGIDVKGDKLRLVIIDKLPFRSPGDPVYKRRLQYAAEQGLNAFTDVQVPEATIALRQGVGRLIRDREDRGLVMLADERLRSRPYGRGMLESLPGMERVETLEAAVDWLRQLGKAASS
jgi:ATP-dependent DNA helicase DinG